jgi:D-glycero-alpha-D-manno-heptose-7-phosphate kinase
MKAIKVRACGRVDLAGGSLDLWPLGLLVPGSVTVNAALGLRAEASLRRDGGEGVRLSSRSLGADYRWRPEDAPGPLALLERYCTAFGLTDGWHLATGSDIPPGSGLGGSSALSVAVASALDAAAGRRLSAPALVALCRDVEAAHLRIPTGVQDFWPAIHGGALALHYEPGGERVERLRIDLDSLGARLIVAYSGESRLSAGTNWALVRRFLDCDRDTSRRLEGIAAAARAIREALLAGDLDGAGRLLGEEWELRKGLAEGIETPALKALSEAAVAAGALGGKACGAGGGGCLAFLVREGARCQVEQALEARGARILAAPPSAEGLAVEVVP